MTVRFSPPLPVLGLVSLLFQGLLMFEATYAQQPGSATPVNWQIASNKGDYDQAVALALNADKNATAKNNSSQDNSSLASLIAAASAKNLATDPQWRAFLHYKPTSRSRWLSQVDSPQFFMSDNGKRSPKAELNATLAAFYSTKAKPPLRLTAYCRFVARRYWLAEQLPELADLLPEQDCPEFDQYVRYLNADVLTLIFPSAHPNSPSSAFGHTLLRVDKKDQRPESRLLNMSINFAAEIPPDVSGAAYAIRGLGGGFPGRFTLLPYHLKLREYGQIENRDTWEYELSLDKPKVDLVLRHTYEMLISEFDYYFFSENCSYHLLSLLDVAYPDEPLTDNFGWWTIPVDTIRLLEERRLVSEPRFVPSAIRTLRARRSQLPDTDAALTLKGLEQGLPAIDQSLRKLPKERQAGVLDLLSDYERYNRLKTDNSAQGNNETERAILSLRSKLGVKSESTVIKRPEATPESGHGTASVALEYQYKEDKYKEDKANIIELSFRPAYHDFRDPSKGYDDKAVIELGLIGVAYDLEEEEAFFSSFTALRIESIAPRGAFFKPISWKTEVKFERPAIDQRHQFTINAGAGVAYQPLSKGPVFFAFGESDLVDAPRLEQRRQLRLGASAGAHWEPVKQLRMGFELDHSRQLGGKFFESEAEIWVAFALANQWSLNVNAASLKDADRSSAISATVGIRAYF